MRKIYNLFLTLFSFLLCIASAAKTPTSPKIGGLYFYGNDVSIQDRTSYQVFNKFQSFPKDSLSISFGIALNDIHSIGHIFTCKSKEDEFINLFISRDKMTPDLAVFTLNMNSFSTKIEIPVSLENTQNIWFGISMKINFPGKEATLTINGIEKSQRLNKTPTSSREIFNLYFGKFGNYLDVISFSLRNLEVCNDKKSYFFPLNEISGTQARDDKNKREGVITYPKWLHSEHMTWTELVSFKEDEIASVWQNEEEGEIIFYTSEEIYKYNIYTGVLSQERNLADPTFRGLNGGGSSYAKIPGTHKTIMFNNLSHDTNSIAVYDEQKDSLSVVSKSHLQTRYHHSSTFPDKNGEYIYQFGGYCRMAYHNDIKRLNLKTYKWDRIESVGDTIPPRFYTAVTTDFSGDKNFAYIYGGFGNEDGPQKMGGCHYHDLYKINLDGMQVEKIGDFAKSDFEAVPCRDLIQDKENECFYTIFYPRHLPNSLAKLYKIDLKTRSLIPYSNEISLISQKISTRIHLLENKKIECLFCIVQEFTSPDKSTVRLYKIRTPLVQYIPIKEEKKTTNTLLYILTIMAGITGIVIVILAKKKNKSKHKEEIDPQLLKEEINEQQALLETDTIKKNTLFFLGDFTVFDRNGKDITYLFSAKIRQLFLLIFMYTFRKSSNGISAKDISSIIWPEKELEKSKNIRGVTIKNLRDALTGVDGIELVNTNKKWLIVIDDSICHCDFLKVLDANIEEINDYDGIRPFMHLLRRGELLKSEHYDWMDNFKADFEENVLSNFGKKMRHAFKEGELMISYKISQVLLTIDPLNEDLIKIEINSLIRMGDPVKAKIKFRQFALNYYAVYEQDLEYDSYILK